MGIEMDKNLAFLLLAGAVNNAIFGLSFYPKNTK